MYRNSAVTTSYTTYLQNFYFNGSHKDVASSCKLVINLSFKGDRSVTKGKRTNQREGKEGRSALSLYRQGGHDRQALQICVGKNKNLRKKTKYVPQSQLLFFFVGQL